MARKKRTKKHVGEIYAINPRHIVKNQTAYNNAKGNQSTNKRLVMVGVEKSSKKVQISNMTTKAKQSELNRYQKVQFNQTYPNKNSFVSTNTISKSNLTKKHFRIGEPPLTKIQRKASPSDITKYQKARKLRGR